MISIAIPVAISFVGYLLVAIGGAASKWDRQAFARVINGWLVIQLIAIGWALSLLYSVGTIATLFAIIAALGFAVEKCGIRYGIPFSPYHYTDALQPQLFGVPLAIPIAWIVMTVPTFATALAVSSHPLISIVVGAQLVAAWDLYLDHTFVHMRFWQWHKRGVVFGIPLVNYFGWFLTALVMFAVIRAAAPQFIAGEPPLVLIILYALNFIQQSIAMLGIWPWREPRLLLFAVPLLCWPLVIIALRMFG